MSIWQQSVNQSVGVAQLTDINQYVSTVTGDPLCPIDNYYRSTQELLRVAKPDFLTQHPSMGPLLLVGIVSTTENYFRDVLAQIIRICPIAKECAADRDIKFGSVLWHGGADAERGAFEYQSFASAKNLRDVCNKFLKYDLNNPKSSTAAILEEFDKVCELRHGIVHSSLVIAGKNAVKLKLQASTSPLKIKIDFQRLHECLSVCTTLVAIFNNELFEEMANRWAKKWPNEPSWKQTDEHKLFKTIWQIFHSEIDEKNGLISNSLSMQKCKNSVKSTVK